MNFLSPACNLESERNYEQKEMQIKRCNAKLHNASLSVPLALCSQAESSRFPYLGCAAQMPQIPSRNWFHGPVSRLPLRRLV